MKVVAVGDCGSWQLGVVAEVVAADRGELSQFKVGGCRKLGVVADGSWQLEVAITRVKLSKPLSRYLLWLVQAAP